MWIKCLAQGHNTWYSTGFNTHDLESDAFLLHHRVGSKSETVFEICGGDSPKIKICSTVPFNSAVYSVYELRDVCHLA